MGLNPTAMFGMSGSAKENAGPNAKQNPNRMDGQPAKAAPRAAPSASANFRSGLYIDSCDAAELSLARAPISEVQESAGRKADPQHTSPLLETETVLAEYSTLAEFTFGLPRYNVLFTSHRIVIKQTKRFLGLMGNESEHSVGYRDLVDASLASAPSRPVYTAAVVSAVLGLLLFAILQMASAQSPAVGLLCVCLLFAFALVTYQVALEHFIEGATVTIDVCKTGRIAASWPLRTNNQSAKAFHIRLPHDQARAALKLLLGHSEFGLLANGLPV